MSLLALQANSDPTHAPSLEGGMLELLLLFRCIPAVGTKLIVRRPIPLDHEVGLRIVFAALLKMPEPLPSPLFRTTPILYHKSSLNYTKFGQPLSSGKLIFNRRINNN
jgi:hypothetical protein